MNSRMFAAGCSVCGKGDIFDFERFLEYNYRTTKRKVQLYPVVAISSRKRTEAGKDAGSISPPSHERRLVFGGILTTTFSTSSRCNSRSQLRPHIGRQHDLEHQHAT